jgi:uncharacterized membrane protein
VGVRHFRQEDLPTMSQIVETLEVEVPVRTAYDQWTQFESFPMFMDGVEQVVQIDDATLVWRAKIAGVTKEWQARIIEQTPDERIAWSSIDGAMNAGVVTFEPIDDHRCRVTLQLDVEPADPIEAAGDALGLVRRQAVADLHNFKAFIETRREETGAWRGEIVGGGVR